MICTFSLWQPQTWKTTVIYWKEVSDKISYSIYPVRLAIKFHNIAALHNENLPSLLKKSPFCDFCHPHLMTFKHDPHLFAPACPNLVNMTIMTRQHHTYTNTSICNILILVLQNKPQGSPPMPPGWTNSPISPLHTNKTYKCTSPRFWLTTRQI